MFKVTFTNNNNVYSLIQRFVLERIHYWNVYLLYNVYQSKKRKKERFERSRNKSHDFVDDEEDLDIHTADEEASSTKKY